MRNNIGNFVSKRAHLNPNTEAVVDVSSGKRMLYPELNTRCNRIGNALVAGGVSKGDRVATLMMNGPESTFRDGWFYQEIIDIVCSEQGWTKVSRLLRT